MLIWLINLIPVVLPELTETNQHDGGRDGEGDTPAGPGVVLEPTTGLLADLLVQLLRVVGLLEDLKPVSAFWSIELEKAHQVKNQQ